MRHIIIFFVFLVTGNVHAQNNLAKLEWLTGTWQRTNAKPGRSGVEIWSKNSDMEFVGRGISLRGTDTVFVEKLKLVVKDEKIFYVADVPQNKQAVYFEMTSLTSTSVTFENPAHDFPKKINYELNGNRLKAVISGDGKAIDYLFEKK